MKTSLQFILIKLTFTAREFYSVLCTEAKTFKMLHHAASWMQVKVLSLVSTAVSWNTGAVDLNTWRLEIKF